MFTYTITDRKERRLLLLICTVVLIVSAAVVLSYNDYFFLGDPLKPNNDDVKYIQSAKVLLNEGTLVYNSGKDPSAFIMPAFVFILSGFMAVFGQDGGGVIAFRLFQCLLQAGSIYLIFIIARYMFNSRIAWAACILSALYLPDYFSSGVILSETIFRVLILVLVCVTITAVQKKHWGFYAGIGALVAAAAYFKPHASLYPAILLILWWMDKYSWREMLRYMSIIVAVYIVLLLPWWIRNLITFDQWITFTNSGGSPFLLGTRINYQLPPEGFFDAYPQYDPKTIFQGSNSTAVAKGLDVLSYGFTHEPLTYLYWYTLGKLKGLYLEAYYWRPIWSISKAAMITIQAILVTLSVIGMIFARKLTTLKRQMPVVLTVIYFTVIYMPFVAFSRYGYPNMVFLLIYTAIPVVYMISKLSRNRRRTRSKSTSAIDLKG